MKISIIGTGTIGGKLAVYLISKGLDVCCITRKETTNVEEHLWSLLTRRNLNDTISKSTIQVFNDYAYLDGSDIIIDATAEKYEVKEAVYKKILDSVKGNPIIATTSSSLDLQRLSKFIRPLELIGLHFFNPPDKMKLVEVSYESNVSEYTEKVIDRLQHVLSDKQFIIMPITQGYICNRILFVLLNAAFNYHLTTGISISDIDNAMELGTNVPMGPFRLSDYIGNDITLSILEQFHQDLGGEQYCPSTVIKDIVDCGKFGRKVKEGFYKYE